MRALVRQTAAVILAIAIVWTGVVFASTAHAEHGETPGCVSFGEYNNTFRFESMVHFTYRVGPDPQYEVWAQDSHIRYYRTCEDQTKPDVHVMVLRRDDYLDGTWRVDNFAWTEVRDL